MSARAMVWAMAAAVWAAGCSGGAPAAPRPAPRGGVAQKPAASAAPAEPREEPPPSGPARPYASPRTTWAELGNGLKVASRIDRAVPVVHVRVAARAGGALDGDATGLAAVCARAVAESGAGAMDDRALRGKLEALGATLAVEVDGERAMYGVSLARDRLGEALELLAAVTARPRLGAADVERVRARLATEAENRARSDGRWVATMVLYQDLFALPAGLHPYASYDATAEEIGKIGPADCRAYHRRAFVPRNMLVAVTGDASPEEVRGAAQKAFGGLRGGEPPAVSFTDPMPPAGTKITLADIPGSAQSAILIGALGPGREEPAYPAFAVAENVLGGPFTGRIWRDLRETRGLAYLTGTDVAPYAGAPSVFHAFAETETKSTGASLGALLEHLQKLAEEEPSAEETAGSAQFLVGFRAVNMGRPGESAEEIVDLWTKQLPDDAPDALARAMREASPAAVRRAFAEHVRPGHAIVVVAGDAAAVGPLLQPFGEVKVVDPTRGFSRRRTLPRTGG